MQLLSQKTVIYATHQVEFLDASDLVLVSYEILVQPLYETMIIVLSSF